MMINSSKRVAILGATGHIANALIFGLSNIGIYSLFLFARSVDRLNGFLICNNINVTIDHISNFIKDDYEVVINCVGIGDPVKLRETKGLIFRLTEEYDDLILDYLERHPFTKYINLSSGAVYGTSFDAPVDDSALTLLSMNNINTNNFYGIAKINSEAKHRSFDNFNIIDLRIFSFFSRFMRLEKQYFLSEIINSIKSGKEFVTDSSDMVRDYVHIRDLTMLVERVIDTAFVNDAFDVYSLKPVLKTELLHFYKKIYGLKVIVKDNLGSISVTGNKSFYYSMSRKAQGIGYYPQYTSFDSIIEETKKILEK